MIGKQAMHEDDLRLARRVARGDRGAFDSFFDDYFPRLYRFSLVRTGGDESLAEELAQATLCQVMSKLHTYRGEASLFTWLCQICRRQLSATMRLAANDPKRRVVLDDGDAVRAALESLSAGADDPERAARGQEIARLVQGVMDYLPERYALALQMKYVQGARVKEIAARLGVGEKAAESTLTRARAAFRDGFRALWDLDGSEVLEG